MDTKSNAAAADVATGVGEPCDRAKSIEPYHDYRNRTSIEIYDRSAAAAAAAAGDPRRIVNWRDCTSTAANKKEVYARVPNYVAPCRVPYPAMCIHVRMDPRIALGVPYVVNRRELVWRTLALTEDMGVRLVDFEHRHHATMDKLGGYVSAGLFICHPDDILIVKGWGYCEARWFTKKSKYPTMARRGKKIRDLWPWIMHFKVISFQ